MKANNIQKLVSNGEYREALHLYAQSLQPNNFTFPSLLTASANLQSIPQTQQLHTHILKTGFQSHIHTSTALTTTYLNLRLPQHALKLFDDIPHPTLPSFNALISGLAQCGRFQESLLLLKRLESQGFLPNKVTIAGVLPACRTLTQGSHLHGLAVKAGYESDRYVATALVTMLSNCGELGSAQKVFRLIPDKTVVSYNAMISGCLRNGSPVTGLDLFREMIARTGLQISYSSLLSLLSLCSELSALLLGKEIHCYSLKCEASSDVTIGTALVDMYSKCGSLELAYRLFKEMGMDRNIVTWNSMMSGFISLGCLYRAVELFRHMRSEGVKPDATTWNLMISGFSQQGNEAEAFKFFRLMRLEGMTAPSLKSMTSLLQACSFSSDLQHGKEIHGQVIRIGAVDGDELIQTALIHMYMRCGCSLQARRMFDLIDKTSNDPALWNAMVSGYGRNGETGYALEIFRKMQEQGVKPNSATFLSILSVCSHSGQVEKGWEIFKMVNEKHGVKPTTEHFSVMVDLLGRAGMLSEAWDLINEIPEPSASVYSSFLGACVRHSDAKLGKVTAERLSKLESGNATPLVILSNIYAREGRWNDVERLRKMITDKGLNKIPGCSKIEVKELQYGAQQFTQTETIKT